MEHQQQLDILIRSLDLLGSSIEDLEKTLPAFVYNIGGDVISEFENGFLLLPQLIENNMLSTDSIVSVLRLNNKVQWCLRNIGEEDFSNEEWNKVRVLAKLTSQLITKS